MPPLVPRRAAAERLHRQARQLNLLDAVPEPGELADVASEEGVLLRDAGLQVYLVHPAIEVRAEVEERRGHILAVPDAHEVVELPDVDEVLVHLQRASRLVNQPVGRVLRHEFGPGHRVSERLPDGALRRALDVLYQ